MRRYLFMYPVKQMLHYHLPTNEYLQAVTAPVTIFNGESFSNNSQAKPGSALFHRQLDSVLSL